MKTTNEFYKKGPEMDGLLGRMEAYAPIDLERIKAEIAQAKRGGTQIRGIAVSITNTGGLHGDEFYSHALVTR